MTTVKQHHPFQIAFFIFFASVIAIGTLLVIRPFWNLIFLALLMAFLLYPLYKLLYYRYHFSTKVSTIIVFVLFLTMVMIPLYVIGSILIQQIATYVDELTKLINSQEFQQGIESFFSWLEQNQIMEITLPWNTIFEVISSVVTSFITTISTFIGSFASSAMMMITNVLVFLVLLASFLPNIGNIRDFFVTLSPMDPKVTHTFIRRSAIMTKDMVVGSFIVSFVNGLIVWFMFATVGVPFASLLGIVSMFLGLLPIVGPSLVTVPVSLLLIINNQWVGSVVILLVHFFIMNNVDLMLRPYITSQEVRIHPAILIIGILGGMMTMGVMGLLYGPIIMILCTTAIEVYLETYKQELQIGDKQHHPKSNNRK